MMRVTNVAIKGNLISKSGTAAEEFPENETTSKIVLCFKNTQNCPDETQETTKGITFEVEM